MGEFLSFAGLLLCRQEVDTLSIKSPFLFHKSHDNNDPITNNNNNKGNILPGNGLLNSKAYMV